MSNNKTILITRPNHDGILNCFYFWTENILDEATRKNLKILDLSGSKATRKNIESYIKKTKPSIILFNGHGSNTHIFGHDNEPLVEYGVNHDLLKDRIVYARSCSSAAALGKLCESKAFIGYANSFWLCTDKTKTFRPMEDKIAERFLTPSNLVVTTLIKGNTAQEAHNRSRKLMHKYFLEMISSKGSSDDKYIAQYLWANLLAQTLHGDPSATI